MTRPPHSWKGAAVLMLLADPAWATELGQSLSAKLALTPIVLDYEVPGHPNEPGRGHAGTIITTSLVWDFDRFLDVEAGVLTRLPFSQDFTEEIGALPVLALTLAPFGPALKLRLGTLDVRHGHHPAVLHEERYAIARPYEELYNRPLDVEREIGREPFLPVETGASIKAEVEYVSAEVYLDWQLLETKAHREKFAVGVLGKFTSDWGDAGFEYRLVHYGGQLFTALREGADPKRQPITLAAHVRPRLKLPYVTLEAFGAFIHGRIPLQETHFGFEVGGDAELFELARLSYRAWLPRKGDALFVSEDGDPVYSGPRSHRASIGLFGTYGIVTLTGRLDLVFAEGTDKVWYQTVTTLRFVWEPLIWSNFRYP